MAGNSPKVTEIEGLRVLPLRVYCPIEKAIFRVNQNQQTYAHFFKAAADCPATSSKPPRRQQKPKKKPAQPRRQIPPDLKIIPGHFHRRRHLVPDDWYVEGKRRDSDGKTIDWKFYEPPGPDGIRRMFKRSVDEVLAYIESKRNVAEKGEQQETISVGKRRKLNEVSGSQSSHSEKGKEQETIVTEKRRKLNEVSGSERVQGWL